MTHIKSIIFNLTEANKSQSESVNFIECDVLVTVIITPPPTTPIAPLCQVWSHPSEWVRLYSTAYFLELSP